MLYQIYLITNKINEKKYVGQTQQSIGYQGRFFRHYDEARREKPTRLLEKALNKYGIDNFSLELVEDNIPEETIDEKEKFYIIKYNSYYLDGFGYNMTRGGQGVHGYKHTEASKEKMSQKSRSYWKDLKENRPEEYNRLISIRREKLKGVPKSEIARKHLSEAAQKHVKSPGYVNPFKGKHHTEQAKRMVAEKNGIKLGMYDPQTYELIAEFGSAVEATKYLIENGFTKNIHAKSRIFCVCDNPDCVAYGFKWKKLD